MHHKLKQITNRESNENEIKISFECNEGLVSGLVIKIGPKPGPLPGGAPITTDGPIGYPL
jgi:hypothetical protein